MKLLTSLPCDLQNYLPVKSLGAGHCVSLASAVTCAHVEICNATGH